MINFEEVTEENAKEYNPYWLHIPDYPSIIVIIDGSGSGKTNALLNLIKSQSDIDKIFLYVKNLYDIKYQYHIKASRD